MSRIREIQLEAFHITSDEVLTWNQIYQILARAAGAPARALLRLPKLPGAVRHMALALALDDLRILLGS